MSQEATQEVEYVEFDFKEPEQQEQKVAFNFQCKYYIGVLKTEFSKSEKHQISQTAMECKELDEMHTNTFKETNPLNGTKRSQLRAYIYHSTKACCKNKDNDELKEVEYFYEQRLERKCHLSFLKEADNSLSATTALMNISGVCAIESGVLLHDDSNIWEEPSDENIDNSYDFCEGFQNAQLKYAVVPAVDAISNNSEEYSVDVYYEIGTYLVDSNTSNKRVKVEGRNRINVVGVNCLEYKHEQFYQQLKNLMEKDQVFKLEELVLIKCNYYNDLNGAFLT